MNAHGNLEEIHRGTSNSKVCVSVYECFYMCVRRDRKLDCATTTKTSIETYHPYLFYLISEYTATNDELVLHVGGFQVPIDKLE